MQEFPRPANWPAWDADCFLHFFSQLTMPNGRAVLVEPWTELVIREIFATGRVEVLILIPKGAGKSALVAALCIWHLLTTANANCFIGAATTIQAKEMWRFACHYINSEPEVGQELLIRGGSKEIRSKRDQGFLLIVASDDSKQGGKSQGYNPTLAVLDELHAHESDRLYVDMRSGLFKNDGILITITTAGWDEESTLGKLRKSFLAADQSGGTVERGLIINGQGRPVPHPDGRLTVARIGRNLMLEWANFPDEDYFDPAVTKLSNPASWQTVESLQDAKDAPGIPPWDYARYRANVWRTERDTWIPYNAWEPMAEAGAALVPGATTVASLDMGRYKDSAALVLIQRRDDGKKVVEALIWRSGGQDDPVPYETVKEAIRAAHETYNLTAVGYDPRYADQLAEELAGEGVAMEKFPPSNERMCPAWAELRKDILEGAFVHDGDPVLRSHMYAGSIHEIGTDQFKVVKAKASGPDMDAAEALAVANVLSNLEEPTLSVGYW